MQEIQDQIDSLIQMEVKKRSSQDTLRKIARLSCKDHSCFLCKKSLASTDADELSKRILSEHATSSVFDNEIN